MSDRLLLFSLLNFTSSFKNAADGLGNGGVLLILGFIDFLSFLSVAKQRDARRSSCEKVSL